MKIVEVLEGQCIRLLAAGSQAQNIDQPALVRLFRKFEDRYGFLQGPRMATDYNLDSGIAFLRGQYKATTITKFSLYRNGVLAEANARTDEIDNFLDDAFSWASTELGFNAFDEPSLRRAYLSQLEVELDIDLAQAFADFLKFGRSISDVVRTYGQNTGEFGIISLAMHCDVLSLDPPKPGAAFTVARREGKPYEDNVYFASAPLTTTDHIRILGEFQAMLTSRASNSRST
jgi:hypothetical protein